MAGKCIQYDPARSMRMAVRSPKPLHRVSRRFGAPLTAKLNVSEPCLRDSVRLSRGLRKKTCTGERRNHGRLDVRGQRDAHDITSDNGAFEESGERLVGTFTHDFATPGSYPYECSIHSAEMSGYFIEGAVSRRAVELRAGHAPGAGWRRCS